MNTDLRMRVAFFSSALLTLLALGCGSGPNDPGTSRVSASQNPLVAKYVVTPSQVGATAWVEFGTDTTYGRQTSSYGSNHQRWAEPHDSGSGNAAKHHLPHEGARRPNPGWIRIGPSPPAHYRAKVGLNFHCTLTA